MSYFESQSTSSHADGYLSDASWFSDFDDSPEGSDICDLPQSVVYSQEIKDNEINENLEAQLANVYENTQPPNTVPEISSTPASPTVNETSGSKISTRNLGAIPKTAFSYLHNEANASNFKKKLINQRNTRNIGNSEDPASNEKSLSPLNPSTSRIDAQVLESSNKLINEKNQESLQNNITSSKPIVPQKPGKLRPEAFSFLSKVIDNESNRETTNMNFKEDKKHFVPTAIVDAANLKRFHTPSSDPQDNIKTDEFNFVDFAPTAPPIKNLQNNLLHKGNLMPNLVPNAPKSAVILQRSCSEGIKPPLPSRPPPVFKYPSGTFSQQLPGTSKETKSAQQNFVFPSSSPVPSSIEIIPNRTDFQTRIDRGARLENVQNEDKKRTIKLIQRDAPVESSIQNVPPRPSSLYDTCFDVQVNVQMNNDDERITRKSPNQIDKPLPKLMNPNILSRPLPPVPVFQASHAPTSRIPAGSVISNTENLKTKNETMNQLIITPPTGIPMRFSINNTLFDAEIKENEPITTKPNFEGQALIEGHEHEFKPEPPRRPKQLKDIIGNQTHVSSQTFESQQKISAAIAARLQNRSSKKLVDDSYEDPKKESDTQVFLEEATKSLGLHMEPSQYDIPPQQANNWIAKGNAHPRTLSDIDELQNAMTRPCLPQKLKTTQRSVSCTSLVQTIKDLGFSKRSPSDKDKRHSEGAGSFEETKRHFRIENKLIEESQPHGISISKNEAMPRKVTATREQKFDIDRSSEKSILSRYAWFHDVNFKEAQLRLLALGEDGTFLIRPSSKPTNATQYTTCVVYRGRVLNLRIRQTYDGQYALGIHKDFEMTFSSLSDLIKYYQDVPIEFHPDSGSASNQEPIYVYLRITPPK